MVVELDQSEAARMNEKHWRILLRELRRALLVIAAALQTILNDEE